MSTDKIEKQVTLRAPLAKVWHAIADSKQFGAWFGLEAGGPFVAGTTLNVRIAPTQVDPDIAKGQQPYAGTPFELIVDTIDPMRRFAFRWHPFAVDKSVDFSNEPTTLVTFDLEEVSGGTKLTITESGFDKLPLERRAKAFAANDGGWTKQIELITKYLAR